MAAVAGLPAFSNINGCDSFSSPIYPAEGQINPELCRTFSAPFRAVGGAALALAVLLSPAPSRAGGVSQTGTTIEVENYRCEVQSPYRIVCENIGRVCIAYREREEAERNKTFGCAIETSPNFPCPPWEDTLANIKGKTRLFGACIPYSFGGW
jgi:hypothetical protein